MLFVCRSAVAMSYGLPQDVRLVPSAPEALSNPPMTDPDLDVSVLAPAAFLFGLVWHEPCTLCAPTLLQVLRSPDVLPAAADPALGTTDTKALIGKFPTQV